MLKPKAPPEITYIGPEDAPERIWAQAITHGQEQAPVLSIQWAAEELRPINVRVALVGADIQGFREEGYGFITLDGAEMVDDPWYRGDPFGDPFLRTAFDENSAWGMSAPLTERHKELRAQLHEFNPTFVLSLHETVGSSRSPFFWGGSGLLLIETYPTAPTDWNLFPGAITGAEGLLSVLFNPAKYLSEMLADWARGLLRRPTYRRLQKGLSKNPHYQLITEIAGEYEGLDGPLCGGWWTDYLGAVYKMSMVGEGRLNMSLETSLTDWLTLASYCVNEFGCPAVTTETFDPNRSTWGIEERAEQSFKFIQATIAALERRAHG